MRQAPGRSMLGASSPAIWWSFSASSFCGNAPRQTDRRIRFIPERIPRINIYLGNKIESEKKGAGSRRPFGGGAAKNGSDQRVVTQRDVNLHAVVEETRRCDRRHSERPGLRYAVEVPGEFATVRNEANDFAVFHVDPLCSAGDVDGAPGKGRYDRALGRGRLHRLAQEVGAHRRGTGGQARGGKRYCEKASDDEFHVILHLSG